VKKLQQLREISRTDMLGNSGAARHGDRLRRLTKITSFTGNKAELDFTRYLITVLGYNW